MKVRLEGVWKPATLSGKHIWLNRGSTGVCFVCLLFKVLGKNSPRMHQINHWLSITRVS